MAKPPLEVESAGHPMRDGSIPLDDLELARVFMDYAVGAALVELREFMDDRGQCELGDWLADAINYSGAFGDPEPRLAAVIRKTIEAYGAEYEIPERYVRRPGSLDAAANLLWNPSSPGEG